MLEEREAVAVVTTIKCKGPEPFNQSARTQLKGAYCDFFFQNFSLERDKSQTQFLPSKSKTQPEGALLL